MPRENLDDYELPYVDFYLEIPGTPDQTAEIDDQADEFGETTIHDHSEELITPTALSPEDVDKLREDSIQAAGPAPQRDETNADDSLFSSK